MSETPGRLAERAADLRRRFDEGFAAPPSTEDPGFQDFLAVRLGGDAFALRRTEITGLVAGRALTKWPTAVPEFLGVLGHRGAIVPVYSLRGMLGYPPQEGGRWAGSASAWRSTSTRVS